MPLEVQVKFLCDKKALKSYLAKDIKYIERSRHINLSLLVIRN